MGEARNAAQEQLEPNQEREDAKSTRLTSRRPILGGVVKEKAPERGILLVSHLPAGFLETQLRKFFAQFGEICRLRLVKSKKTGQTKGYAFVEFAFKEVADIAAETMNGYLLFGKKLKARSLSREDVPSGVFTNYIPHPRRGHRTDKARQRMSASGELTEANASKILQKEAERRKKLQAAGIAFTPPSIQSKLR